MVSANGGLPLQVRHTFSLSVYGPGDKQEAEFYIHRKRRWAPSSQKTVPRRENYAGLFNAVNYHLVKLSRNEEKYQRKQQQQPAQTRVFHAGLQGRGGRARLQTGAKRFLFAHSTLNNVF